MGPRGGGGRRVIAMDKEVWVSVCCCCVQVQLCCDPVTVRFVIVSLTVFGTAKPCNPQGSQGLMGWGL